MSTVPVERGAPAARWVVWAVLAAALASAALLYQDYARTARLHWWGPLHDRHAHLVSGMNLAMDVRTGEGVRFLHDLDKLRVWGPLDPLVEACVQLAAGPDYRLAVLPSLAAWVLTVVLGCLLARRLLPAGGAAAGLVAAAFIAASPAHRAFATDAMLESPGACLTLLCVYAYVLLVQDNRPRGGLYLACALSLLFLLKCNYWVVAALGLAAAECVRRPGEGWAFARRACRRETLLAWARLELRQPLNYLALALAAAAAALLVRGGGVVRVAGQEVSVRQPHNLIHLAYAALCLRLVLWLRQGGLAQLRRWPAAARDLAVWHGGVLLAWFLLPKRLADFLFYLSPTNTDLPPEPFRLLHGLPFYLHAAGEDYLAGPAGVCLFGLLLALAACAWPRLRPGSGGAFFVFLVGACLTCQHPMMKNRFLHSWIALGWVLAAVGLVGAARQAAGWLAAGLRPWGAALACALAVLAQAPALVGPGWAQESGVRPARPPALAITDAYLPALEGARQPTILGNMPLRFLAGWTFAERHGRRRVTVEVKDFKDKVQHDEERVRRWLAGTPSDALVLIDVHRDSPYFVATPENVDLGTLEQVLGAGGPFVRARRWELPERVSITLWTRAPTGESVVRE
jgi:hypothetical protein